MGQWGELGGRPEQWLRGWGRSEQPLSKETFQTGGGVTQPLGARLFLPICLASSGHVCEQRVGGEGPSQGGSHSQTRAHPPSTCHAHLPVARMWAAPAMGPTTWQRVGPCRTASPPQPPSQEQLLRLQEAFPALHPASGIRFFPGCFQLGRQAVPAGPRSRPQLCHRSAMWPEPQFPHLLWEVRLLPECTGAHACSSPRPQPRHSRPERPGFSLPWAFDLGILLMKRKQRWRRPARPR